MTGIKFYSIHHPFGYRPPPFHLYPSIIDISNSLISLAFPSHPAGITRSYRLSVYQIPLLEPMLLCLALLNN